MATKKALLGAQGLDANGQPIVNASNITASNTITAQTFSGSGASLTNIPNSALNNSSITINSTPVSLGGSITVSATDSSKLPLAGGTLTGSLSGTSASFSSSVTASSLIKSGGISSQFLKADGSVDANTYYLASNPSGYITSSATITGDARNITQYAINQNLSTTSSPTFGGLTVDTNTLFVDATNDRVGVGTVSPAYKLDVSGTLNASGSITQNGSQVLTAGNYSSYALPLSGGVVTGSTYYRKNQTDGAYTSASLWTESYGNTTTGIAFHISGVVGKFLEMRTNGTLYFDNNTMIHSGNYNSYAPTLTGTGASGTWGINVTGSTVMVDRGSVTTANIDNATGNGFYLQQNSGDSHSVLVFNPFGSTAVVQQRFHYTGTMEFRNKTDSANWQPWKTVLTSANYSSYALPLSGGTISGALTVTGNSTFGSALFNGLRINGTDTNVNQIWQSNSGTTLGITANGGAIVFGQTSSEQMRLTAGGSLGLGTSSPSAKLTVKGVTAIGQFTNGTAVIDAYGSFAFYGCNVADNGLRIGPSGDVGIGFNPSYKLDINGTARTTGRFYSNEWIQFDNFSALYSPHNGAHFLPNASSYGSWKILGQRNGWCGLEFETTSNGNISLMIQPDAGTSGFHNNSVGWQFRWNVGTLYCHKGTYGGGTVATVLDSSNFASYTLNRNGDNTTGVMYFTSNKGGSSYLGSQSGYSLQAYSSDGGSASMSFHRGGYYAVNMGLDPDNVFRIGGWSASANRLQLDMSGNLTVPYTYANSFNIINDSNNQFSQGALQLRDASATIYLRDTNHNSAMIHCNSNIFYILRGGNDTTTWATTNGYWPLEINLTNNDATFGRHIYAPAGYIHAVHFNQTSSNSENDTVDQVITTNGDNYFRKVSKAHFKAQTGMYSNGGSSTSNNITISSSSATGGSNGDIWLKY